MERCGQTTETAAGEVGAWVGLVLLKYYTVLKNRAHPPRQSIDSYTAAHRLLSSYKPSYKRHHVLPALKIWSFAVLKRLMDLRKAIDDPFSFGKYTAYVFSHWYFECVHIPRRLSTFVVQKQKQKRMRDVLQVWRIFSIRRRTALFLLAAVAHKRVAGYFRHLVLLPDEKRMAKACGKMGKVLERRMKVQSRGETVATGLLY